MAKMKLYYSPGSPCARKVRVVAMETRLDRKMEMVNVAVSPVVPNADVDKHNPIAVIFTSRLALFHAAFAFRSALRAMPNDVSSNCSSALCQGPAKPSI